MAAALPDPCHYQSVPGLANITSPIAGGPTGKPGEPGPPIYVTPPHFCQADPSLAEGVEGLHCDPEQHLTYLDVEPITGERPACAQRPPLAARCSCAASSAARAAACSRRQTQLATRPADDPAGITMRASKRFMVSSQLGTAGHTLEPKANGSTVTPIMRGEEGSQLLGWQADKFRGSVYAAKRAKKALEHAPVWVGLACLVGAVLLVLVQMMADGVVQYEGGAGAWAADAAERQPLLGDGGDGALPVSSGAASADGAEPQPGGAQAGGALSNGLVGPGFTATASQQGAAGLVAAGGGG